MTNDIVEKKSQPGSIAIFQREEVQKKFSEVLGKRSVAFTTTVLGIVSQSEQLRKADPNTVYMAALTAASLSLPINPNLGFAYIVPYNNRKTGKQEAQFQMGYKGFIQLAQRSGQFKTIDAKPVYEGQYEEDDSSFMGFKLKWSGRTSDKIVGYASYFELINGFAKVLYMPTEELQKHGKKYSQTYKKGTGLWETDFDSMALKTTIKLILQKFAPLSVEMEDAVIKDQAIIDEKGNIDYIDNPALIDGQVTIDNDLLDDWRSQIDECNTIEDLDALRRQNKPTNPDVLSLFEEKENDLKAIQD